MHTSIVSHSISDTSPVLQAGGALYDPATVQCHAHAPNQFASYPVSAGMGFAFGNVGVIADISAC